MRQIIIAATAALSLALNPVAAQAQTTDNSFQHEDLATALFALIALGVIGKALTDNADDDDDRVATPLYAPGHEPRRLSPDRGGIGDRNDRPVVSTNRSNNNNRSVTAHGRALPISCMRSVQTSRGNHRFFGRTCLQNNYAQINRLPNRCAVRIAAPNGIRRGFDPVCLRNAGFGVDRRR